MSLHATFHRLMITLFVLTALLSPALTPHVTAQTPPSPDENCQPAWVPTFGAEGVDQQVTSTAVFDDGTGPALYVIGDFTAAGGAAANHIAKWDGQSWSPVGTGMGFGYANTLFVLDDGSGPALFAGGQFQTIGGVSANSVAKWNGQSWAPLGSGINGRVAAMTIFDDGAGPALYAGGKFSSAGGVAANNIAKWDGQSWSPLKSEITLAFGQSVNVLTVFDDGSGPALFVGASSPPPDFITEAAVPLTFISKWDGTMWSSLRSGINRAVVALTVFDDGTGSALYAGGNFSMAGGAAAKGVARWDGQSWSPLGSGMDSSVDALTVFNDGSGAALIAGGMFTTAGGMPTNHIARWDGQSWSPLASGIGVVGNYVIVSAMAVFDDGTGPAIFVGGEFLSVGEKPAHNIARWDGESWATLGSGISDEAFSTTVFDDGFGPALFVGGKFISAQGVTTNHIAKWSDHTWSPLGTGVGGVTYATVYASAVFDDGSGPALYVGGQFSTAGGVSANNIARWDGQSWSPLESRMSNGLTVQYVGSFAVFDDGSGPALYAGGGFIDAGSGAKFSIAKWNGQRWTPLGIGVTSPINSYSNHAFVSALAVFDDGLGPALYVGGFFATAGSTPASSIARWDGQRWSSVAKGVRGVNFQSVSALTVFDDGTGAALYAGGNFTIAGGMPANYIAKWDGQSWSPLGSGLSNSVFSLTDFDDGAGSALYASGFFTTAGNIQATNIAKWDGVSWSPLSNGLPSGADTLTVFDDGSGPALFAAGQFAYSQAGDAFLAKYQGCASSNPADLDGDGVVNGADLGAMLSNWGPCVSGSLCGGDLDADGVVDAADLATLLANWG